MTQNEKKAYAVVIYEMKDNTEQRQPVYDSEELKHERAHAEREVHDPKSYVKGYRVEYPKPEDQRAEYADAIRKLGWD